MGDKNELLNRFNNVKMEEGVLRQIDEMTNEAIIVSNHPYKITQLNNGRWQSYYKPKESNERICIRASTRPKLIKKLAEFYIEANDMTKITVDSLYHKWLAYKKQFCDSPNTICRHEQHYNKYFKDTKLFKIELNKVDVLEIESVCNSIIKSNNMTRKEWTNIKTILNGMFKYAERKGYINDNPMRKVEITVKFRQTIKKHGSAETFNKEERTCLIQYLDKMYNETDESVFMAVKVNLMLGLRVSELVALKWGDIVEGKKLHVVRGEIRNQEAGYYEVVNHTKTYRDRYVEIPSPAMDIFNKVKSRSQNTKNNDYIFTKYGERATARQITYVLEKYAERQNKDVKRSHKLRKTYASVLATNGVPVDEIRNQLGHSNLQTTMAYIFNPLAEEETHKLISGIFADCV